MKLDFVRESLDGLDEQYHGLYEEKDGKFILQVDGGESDEAVAGLKKALDAERARVKRLQQERKDAPGLPDDFDLEEYNKLKQEAADRETKEAERRGEWDKLKARLKEDHQKALDAKDATIAALSGQVDGLLIDNEVRRAAEAAGGYPDLLLPHARRQVKAVVNDDGTRTVQVVDADGTPALAEGGEAQTIEGLLKVMKGQEAFAPLFKGTGATGSGSPGGKGAGGAGQVASRAELKTDKDISDYISEHGLEAFEKLPVGG